MISELLKNTDFMIKFISYINQRYKSRVLYMIVIEDTSPTLWQ
jgi:hypothetical protein